MNQSPVPYQTFTLGSTGNFTVLYENADRGENLSYDAAALAVVQRRAQAILSSCETDYATLCLWFGVSVGQDFGPSNRVQVTLTTSDGQGGLLSGAYNQGHDAKIFVNPYTLQPDSSNDDAIVGLFVAEFIEVMMSYHGAWQPGDSSGEGLSRVAAHLLHPTIITSFFDKAPMDISWWMSRPPTDSSGWLNPGGTNPTTLPSHTSFRQDWVSQTFKGENGVPGDLDWFSFGCAILFIYYLKDQLGFTMAKIVQSAGSTLEDRYQSLTGKTGGYAPFRAVLDAFYPTGAPLPAIYDLFPLGDRLSWIAAIAVVVQDDAPSAVRTGVAQAGTMCGPRDFNYTLYNLKTHVHVTADISGFAHPLVSWSINGIAILSMGGTISTVPAVVIPEDPSATSPPGIENVQINVTTGPAPTYPEMSTFLDISVLGNPGQVQLRIDVTVTDQFATGTKNMATSHATTILDTQKLVWDPEYRRTVDECWNRYITTHNRRLPWLHRYMPDPPVDLLAAVQVLERLASELREVAIRDPKLARQIDQKFGGHLLSGPFSSIGRAAPGLHVEVLPEEPN